MGPISSAFLYLLALPPFGLSPLGLVALVPWFIQLSKSNRASAFWSGYIFGAIVVLGQMHWVVILVERWTGSIGLAIIPWIVCGILGAFYFAVIGVLWRSAYLRGLFWAIPLIWAGVEVGRSFIPGLAFPWFLSSTPLTGYPVIDQLAFFGTQYLVGAWVCFVNLLLAGFWLSKRPNSWHWVVAAAFPVMSTIWYLRPLQTRNFKVAIGQPGVDMAFGEQSRRDSLIEARIDELEDQAIAAHAVLLVLPEGVIGATDFPPAPSFELPPNLPVLFGGQRGHGPAYQTAFLFNHGRWSYADKTRLVVFGEYVPGRQYFPFLQSFKLPGGDLTAADKVSPLRLDHLVIGPMLCFEGLFYDVAHKQSEAGAQILANMSIDDWYMGTSAPEQLREAATWRAIETGLPVVRSAATGYTLAVDQKGRTLATLPLGSSNDLIVDVPIESSPLRNPLRPLFPWLAGMFPFAFAAFCGWQRNQGK